MPLLALPNELLLIIASRLKNLGDVNALSQVCRRLYEVLNFYVYVRDIKDNYGCGLILAARHGHLGAVRKFLDQGQDPYDYLEYDKGIPLIEAAKYGHEEIVLLLVDHIPATCHMNFVIHNGALCDALRAGHDQVARILIDRHPDPPSSLGDEPELFNLAMTQCSSSILALMLKRGFVASVSLLNWAVSQGKNDCVKVFLDWGYDVNSVEPNDGRSPLYSAAGNGQAATVRLLLDRGADPYRKSTYDFMPLFIATLLGHEDVVRTLLDFGVNPEGLDEKARYPPKKPREEFFRVISGEYMRFSTCDSKRDLFDNAHLPGLQAIVPRSSNCHTPLCVAAMMGHEDIVRLLLDRGVDPNFIDPNGDVPLRLAAMNNRCGIISLLLERGAWIDFVDLDGKTALGHALSNGCHDATILLIYAGATEDLARIGGEDLILQALNHRIFGSPSAIPDMSLEQIHLYCAIPPTHGCRPSLPPRPGVLHRCETLLEFFLDRGSSVDSQDSLGRTLLHHATYLFCISSIEFLLARGADPNVCDMFGRVPLYIWLQNPSYYPISKFQWHQP
ncbi:hypothetical protein N7523_001704 [Penicillium sp. IBT 18751x]|nr:hypothetical protein N7523_001704 [Penicillium sp. IBT 18751x]